MANQHRDCSLSYTSESKECRYVGRYHWLTSHARLEASGREHGECQMSEKVIGGPSSLCLLLPPLCF